MKNFFSLTARRAARMGIALAGIATLASCATTDSASSRSCRVLETRNSSNGEIASLRSFESGSMLYVTGSLRRSSGHSIPHGAHVDIELIDRSGRVIASRQDRIESVHPRQESRRGGRHSFTAGFPLEAARGSDRIRVIYHLDPHS